MRSFVGVTNKELLKISELKNHALFFDRVAIVDLEKIIENLNAHKSESDNFLAEELLWLWKNDVIFDPRIDVSQNVDGGEEYFKLKQNHVHFLGDMLKDFEMQRGALLAFEKERNESEKIIGMLEEVLKNPNTINEQHIEAVKMYLKSRGLLFEAFEHFHESQTLIGNCFRDADLAMQWLLRYEAAMCRLQLNVDAYPILSVVDDFSALGEDLLSSPKSEVIKIVLDQIPIPNDSTPWEQIMDFRDDSDAKKKFRALRVWISEISRSDLPISEIEEKLEYLIDEYKEYMRIHQKEFTAGVLEAILVTVAETLSFENIIKWKWASETVKRYFSIEQKKIDLLKAERNAPGKEIAYLVKTKDSFSS